jgi:predicted anti-sigma-YlaC factor YlaD
MNCEEFTKLIASVLNGQIAEEQIDSMEEHRKHCEACREELQRQAEVWSLLKTVSKVQPSPAMHESFFMMLEQNMAEQGYVIPDSEMAAYQKLRSGTKTEGG